MAWIKHHWPEEQTEKPVGFNTSAVKSYFKKNPIGSISMNQQNSSQDFQMIYVASCGEGINAYNHVESTLVQFPDKEITVVKVPHIRTENQVDELIEKGRSVFYIVQRMAAYHEGNRILY